jgi:hypothetical protein
VLHCIVKALWLFETWDLAVSESISLYLELEPNRKADIEVVSRAALAFSAAVKEMAYILDPSIELRIELASGTEGSLSLNSVLRIIRNSAKQPSTPVWLIFVVLSWFASDIRSYETSKLIDQLLQGTDAAKHLTEEEIALVVERVRKSMESDVARDKVQVIFQEIERDEAIVGVGATTEPGERPKYIIPRELFWERSGAPGFVHTSTQKRSREDRVSITLVSPVLLPGRRKWRFSFHEGEFGAQIKDEVFLDHILRGVLQIPLASGLILDAVLETKEEFQDGVWIVKERSILKVHGVKRAPIQDSLFSPTPNDISDDQA